MGQRNEISSKDEVQMAHERFKKCAIYQRNANENYIEKTILSGIISIVPCQGSFSDCIEDPSATRRL